MIKLRLILLLSLFPSIVLGQNTNRDDARLKIDYWLQNYTQANQTDKCEMAEKVFTSLLAVADKPIGVLPKLYIFSNLEFSKVFALPDGSIILPLNVIDFCIKNHKDAQARLAFLLGHELKHIVRGDYWMQRILEFAPSKHKGLDNSQMQKMWEYIEWDISQQVRRNTETEADEYGLLYASLAGYDIRSILSPSNTFISDYYRAAGIDIHGDLANNQAAERLRALNQRLDDIVTHLDLFNFGVRLYVIGKYDAAIELLQKFLTQYPSREVFNNLGMCYYQNALLHYKKWKRQENDINPNLVFRVSAQVDPFARIQKTYRTVGANSKQLFWEMIDKAIENFKEATNRDLTYETALNNLGCAYLLKGEIDFAKGNFKKALELNSSCKEAYNNLGVAYLVEGEARDAITHFRAALSLQSDFPVPIYNLGQLNYQNGHVQDASEYYKMYLQLDSTSIYAAGVRKRLGTATSGNLQSNATKRTSPKTTKSIRGRWSQFLTPTANISVCHDTTQAIDYFQFLSKQSNEKISIMVWTERYQGTSEKGISVGAPENLTDEAYSYPYSIMETTRGAFRIYSNLGVVFEIRNRHLHSWFQFEVM